LVTEINSRSAKTFARCGIIIVAVGDTLALLSVSTILQEGGEVILKEAINVLKRAKMSL
jgi:hypothetical protein